MMRAVLIVRKDKGSITWMVRRYSSVSAGNAALRRLWLAGKASVEHEVWDAGGEHLRSWVNREGHLCVARVQTGGFHSYRKPKASGVE